MIFDFYDFPLTCYLAVGFLLYDDSCASAVKFALAVMFILGDDTSMTH